MQRKDIEKMAAVAAFARSGDFLKAEQALRTILRKRPSNTEALTVLATLHAQKHQWDAALPLFERVVKIRPDDAEAHFRLGVTQSNLGRSEDARAAYRAALVLNPRHLSAITNLGGELLAHKCWAEALALYTEAAARMPAEADAFAANLGIAQLEGGHLDDAIETLSRVIQSAPENSEAYSNLGMALQRAGRLQQAEETLRRALTISPNSGSIHNNLGLTLLEMGRMAEAIAAFESAVSLSEDVSFRWNLGMALLLQGDFARGWPQFRYREDLRRAPGRPLALPFWQGEPLAGKKIVVWSEQGLGDTLQYARYLPELIKSGAQVTFECPKPLVRLFTLAFPMLTFAETGDEYSDHDFQCSLIGLAGRFGIETGSIVNFTPYLTVDNALALNWKQKLAEPAAFKIGICWQGSPKYSGDKARSIPLRNFEPLLSLPGVRVFSLQKPADLDRLVPGPLDDRIETFGPDFDSAGAFVDTAAVMESLDLVISCDSAIAHLAGALARPVIVALRRMPDWRWQLGRNDSPWYPSARLFRQEREGDWEGVFARIAEEVNRRIGLRKPA